MSARREKILRPLRYTSKEFYPFFAAIGLITLVFLYAYMVQLGRGMGVTGLNDITIWGIYIVNFIFFIGISHVGIAISAAVRILRLESYRPIARMAEILTLVSLMMAGLSIVIDLGRPDRLFLLIQRYGSRIGTSPLLWDITAVGTYLILSSTYLYLPMRKDLSICMEYFDGWRRRLYRLLLPGYEEGEEKVINRLSWWMAVTILPVMVMVHTTVAWIFSLLSSRPLWFGAVAGPMYIVAAIASGVGSVIVIAAVVRHLFHWEDIIPPEIFRGLGNFLAVATVVYLYFMLAEQLTARYAGPAGEFFVSESWLFGAFAPVFWTMVFLGMFLPFLVLIVQALRPNCINVSRTAMMALIIVVAFWLKRYIIIVPTLTIGVQQIGVYTPTWVEISVFAGTFSLMTLLYTVMLKLVPIIELGGSHGE